MRPKRWVRVPLTGAVISVILLAVGAWPGSASSPIRATSVDLAGSASAPDAWPTYLHDPQRSGADLLPSGLNRATAPNLTLLWKFPTNGTVVSGPAVVGTTVYVGSWDGFEYALNVSTGAKRWSTFLGQSSDSKCGNTVYGVTSTATWANGTLYVGGGSAKWYALSPTSGKILWKVSLGDPTRVYDYSSPLVVGHHGFVGLASFCDRPMIRGELAEVGLDTHRLVGSFGIVPAGAAGGAIWSSPTYDPSSDSIFVTTGNGQKSTQAMTEAFVAIDASTLKRVGVWQVPRNATGIDLDFGSTPTLVNPGPLTHLIVAANKNGELYALSSTKLSAGPVWKVPIALGGPCPQCGNGSIAPAAFDGQSLYAAGGATRIAGTAVNGSVRSLSPSTGALRWSYGTTSPVLAPVAYADGLVAVAAGTTLTVLNSSSGHALYRFSAGGKLWGPVAIVNGCLFFGSLDHNVYALGLPGSTCGGTAPSGSGHLPHPPPGPSAPAGVAGSGGSSGLALGAREPRGPKDGLRESATKSPRRRRFGVLI